MYKIFNHCRWTLPSHPTAACHSLLPVAMRIHNADVLHTQTPSGHALPGTGTCYLLIHQHSTPLLPSRVIWTLKLQVNIVLNLIVLSCRKRGLPVCLLCVQFTLRERFHFRGRRSTTVDCHRLYMLTCTVLVWCGRSSPVQAWWYSSPMSSHRSVTVSGRLLRSSLIKPGTSSVLQFTDVFTPKCHSIW